MFDWHMPHDDTARYPDTRCHCTIALLGLAVAAAGTAATVVAKQKADDAQIDVIKNATKLNAATAKQNDATLMGEAKGLAPAAQTASDAAAAGQADQAMTGQTKQALGLFTGAQTARGPGNAAQAARVAGVVQSGLDPRTHALATIQGNAEGNRRRLQLADATNAQIDANTSATNRMLGLLPGQMQYAGMSGRGLALGGQLAGVVGNGMVQSSMWSKPAADPNAPYLTAQSDGPSSGGYATYGN